MDCEDYVVAIKWYSDALTLGPPAQRDILLKRSKAHAILGSWEEVLLDVDKVTIACRIQRTLVIDTPQVIELDPLSHEGYERKHAALHVMGRYHEAFRAFRTMLSTLEGSPNPLLDGRHFINTPQNHTC